MPYIPPENREDLELAIKVLVGSMPSNGEINYIISRLMVLLLEQRGTNYDSLNELMGVLECAKLEVYRRWAAPYEDKKIQENGDIVS